MSEPGYTDDTGLSKAKANGFDDDSSVVVKPEFIQYDVWIR